MNRIENTFDEVLFAAVQAGLEADREDLAQVRVPAGLDAGQFSRDLQNLTRQIVALRKEGRHGDARQIASKAQSDYLAHFAALMPVPAGQQIEQQSANTDADHDALGARIFRS